MHILGILFLAPLALMLGLGLARNFGNILVVIMLLIFAFLILGGSHNSSTYNPATTLNNLNADHRPVEPRSIELDNIHIYQPGETVSGRSH